MTVKLETMFDMLHVSFETCSADEIKNWCELIVDVQRMTVDERDCIRASFQAGPLHDGDVPSRSARDVLVSRGYMAKVVVRGEDGNNACTNKGAWAYRLIEAGA